MTIVVAGLGRCGSSLVMQMLNAGGVACVGAYPAFEEHEPERWQHWDGKAVKILDPHRQRLPLRCVVIWLDRNPVEQAKSQVKLLTACGVAVPTKATALMCQRLRQDRQQALSVTNQELGDDLNRLAAERGGEIPPHRLTAPAEPAAAP